MRETIKAISQRAAREALGNPESFSCGLYPSCILPPTAPTSWPICSKNGNKRLW